MKKNVTQGQFFYMEINRFEFRVFFLLDQLSYQGQKYSLPYYFTHSWREMSWIHTFPKVINAIWNANSLVQALNLGYCGYFLQQ